MRKIVLRIVVAVVLLCVVAVGAAAYWGWSQIRGSLAQLDNERTLAGLSSTVTVERDELGIPTIKAANRADLAMATGFVHAQERFFQMDLLRRSSAGELAELVGSAAVEHDMETRVHRFRHRAQLVVEASSEEQRALLDAYTTGVNAGLEALSAAPFEYLLMRVEPQPWTPEDSVLVLYAMYLDLQGKDYRDESTLGVINDLMPAPMFDFLAPLGTDWDAPVEGWSLPMPRVPGPQVYDLRSDAADAALPSRSATELANDPQLGFTPGSNSWAVAGTHTSHGGALVANDMHLGIAVPNIWFRASFEWPDEERPDEPHRITGATLPGTPVIVVGSNGHIAWAFTNSQGDWSDLVVLTSDSDDPRSYRTPEGSKQFERQVEFIKVRDELDTTIEVVETIWGPIIDRDHRGRKRALRWVAHDLEAVNLGLLQMETVRTLDDALEQAAQCGSPAQNFVVADADGRIAWTILGRIPKRFGFDGRVPMSWSDGSRGWDGYLEPEDYPRIVDPPSGRIWTANARVVSGEKAEKLGHGFYDLGARAGQIRDGLLEVENADEQDMLDIQLDDRALFLKHWQELLLEVLSPEAVKERPARAELREFVENWGERASIDSVGYRIVRNYRLYVVQQALDAVTARCRRADGRCHLADIDLSEGPAWSLVTERPPHLLDPAYESWDAFLLAAADAVQNQLTSDEEPLDQKTWGQQNTTQIHHPLSLAVPSLSTWLDMPAEPLPGDAENLPRIQRPSSGASQRLAVSPGREDEGYFHMPCGQSGHPLSPHYGDGHAAWAEGLATPFLPGPAVHTLVLKPAK